MPNTYSEQVRAASAYLVRTGCTPAKLKAIMALLAKHANA